MAMTIISHLYRDDEGHWVIQTNQEHSDGVAKKASAFASDFGMATLGEILGKLHDKGKETYAFQQHIRKESGYDESAKVKGDFQHSYIGGRIAYNMYGKTYKNFFANQIVSHHTGLHDSDEIESMINKDIPTEVDTNFKKIQPNHVSLSCSKEDVHHLQRMLFSCLVDADYLDTEEFMDKTSCDLRNNKETLVTLLPKLELFIEDLKSKSQPSLVNTIRSQVQEQCIKMSESPVGFYSLTVPTGGGKTLSSLLWAMKHAVCNGQKRVIIAIPYTSIIVQTSSILRSIFGEENVLEHHSNVDIDQIKEENLKEKIKLATENWDYPIIVTTNVQLFESMFSNKISKCRKLHNIVNSVIVLDEVQTLPTNFLQPIVDSLKSYNKLFNVSVLFTTASQPILSGLIEGCNPKASFDGVKKVTEIIPSDFKLHDRLRRVRLEIDNNGKSYDEIAEALCKYQRVLCIVNTRKDAKELFSRLPDEGVKIHLSKMMCPAHISQKIEEMKKALQDTDNKIIRVVSTQLIEAGVDIDFPVVFRQEAGLDSVLQAAGRCNREGKQTICTTYVFSLSKEHQLPSGEITAANNARLNMIDVKDWLEPRVMTEYFRQFYSNHDTFDKRGIKNYLYNCEPYFATAAKEFRLIEDVGTNVVVCWEDSMDLLQELVEKGPSYGLMKKLSKYYVNITNRDLRKLQQMGVVDEIIEGILAVKYQSQYDSETGLSTDNKFLDTIIIN